MTAFAGEQSAGGRAIEVDLVTRADSARVWEAVTNPARVVEWFADRAEGGTRPGDTITWSFDRMASELSFTVNPLTAPGRLVLEGTRGTPGHLELMVGAAHDGTRVSLIHSGLPQESDWDDDYRSLAAGWRLALAVLRYYAEFHFGQPRKQFFASRLGRFSLARLVTLFHEPAGLQDWLTEGGSMGTPGGRVHLALKTGETLRGDMLADTGTDIAMAWDEIGGVLQLRTLPGGHDRDSRLVCATGWGWGVSSERVRQIEIELAAALERLERAVDPVESGQGVLQSR